MPDYQFDVVIPTHNHLKLTMGCIDALYQNTALAFHLIIVDDSTDLTVQYIEQLLKEKDNITFIHSDEPYKCGNQIFNIGVKNCKTPYIATVMNSVEVEPEWEKMALKLLTVDPKIGTIGLKCLFASSGLIECAGIYIHDYLPCDIGRDEASHRLSIVYQCEATQWAFAMHRVAAIKGNLSENVYHGFVGVDDIDNCFSIRHKGWKVMFCGVGVGYHHPRATRGRNDAEAYNLNRENLEHFYKRWGYWADFHKSNPEIPETLKGVRRIADGKMMMDKEISQGDRYVRSVD